MTKQELAKCEKLMGKAIRCVSDAEEGYREHDKFQMAGESVNAEVALRKADQKYGAACGIYHALTMLGFKHIDMKKLNDLL